MHDSWRQILLNGGVVIIDGGTGSELRRRGVTLSPTAWSGTAADTHAELLRDIHLDYIDAGADVITTNTFGTTRFVLEAAGLGADFERINQQALWAALEARERSGRDVSIAGSISCLPPRFDVNAYPDHDTELAAYIELAQLLADNGADMLVLEMMQETQHAVRAAEAAKRTGLPLWLGLSCRMNAAGELVGYDFPQQAFAATLETLAALEPDAINIMHSPPGTILPALAAARQSWHGVLGAYPEITSQLAAGGAEAVPDDNWIELCAGWRDAGAQILGGCCGTTPDQLRALRQRGPWR